MTFCGGSLFCFAYSGFVFTKTLVGVSFRTGLRGQGRGEIDFRCQSSPLPCPPRPPTPPPLTGLVWAVTNTLTQVEGWRKVLCSQRGEKNPVWFIELTDRYPIFPAPLTL